jgi:hypothetical protein
MQSSILGAIASTATPSQAGMTTGDWIGAAQNAVQGFAILVGGAWAYWKFVRGRTFHRRAELTVDASLIASSPRVVRAKVTMRNTGASDIPMFAQAVEVYAFAPGEVDPETKEPNWILVGATGAFRAHAWVESQETINDDVLVQLESAKDRPDTLALRATCVVVGKRKRRVIGRKRSTKWTSHAAIVVGPAVQTTTSNPEREMPDV